ncbi:hypothetical protein D3C79_752840 [compost metagenome]
MVLTRRLFKVEHQGGAHKGGLAVRRFEQIDPQPGVGTGAEPGLLFQLAAGGFDQVLARLHMAGGLVEAALARDLLFHQQEAALPVHQGGDRQSGRHGGMFDHDDSLS